MNYTQKLLSAVTAAGLLLVSCGAQSGGDVKVVFDLPATGPARTYTQAIDNAITLAFIEKEYRVCAGRWVVQYEAQDAASHSVSDPGVVAMISVSNTDAIGIRFPIPTQPNRVEILAGGAHLDLETLGALTGKVAEWVRVYKSMYGADPGPQALDGYVAAQVLFAAFERVCAAGQSLANRQAVREAVFATQDFESLVGKVSIEAR